MHGLTEDFQLFSFCLAAKWLPGSSLTVIVRDGAVADDHTAKNLYDFYVDVFNAYGILEKIVSGTTDNAANFVASISASEKPDDRDKWAGVRCFIHTLQLAVHDALKVTTLCLWFACQRCRADEIS